MQGTGQRFLLPGILYGANLPNSSVSCNFTQRPLCRAGGIFFAATGQLDVHLQVEVARPCFQSAAAFRDPIRARGFRRDQTLHVEPSYAWARNRFRHGLATLIRRSDSSEAAAVVHELRQVEAPQQCDEADRNNAIVIIQRSSQWLGMCGLFGITNQQTKSGGQRITR